jgi:outer membrane protein TolC
MKMKNSFAIMAAVFALLCSAFVFAEDGAADKGTPDIEIPGIETLSIEQARSLALANSRSLAKYNLTMQNNRLAEKAQFYTNLPSLSLSANTSTSLWNQNEDAVNPNNGFDAGLSFGISQRLFNGGKSLLLAQINKISSEITRKEALAAYFEVIDSADTAYYNVLEAQVSLEAAESGLQTAVLGLSMAEIRSANGMIRSGDYLQALAEKETRENSRNQARRNLALKAAQLKAITGLSELPALEANLDAYENVISRLAEIPDEKVNALYDALWKISAAGNPGLARAGLSSLRAEKNLALTARDYSPTINAGFPALSYSVQKGLVLSNRFSISGSIPLDFWSKANSVGQSKIARDQSNLDYLTSESTLEIDLQTALLSAISQAETVLSTRRACEYTEKHFEYVMELYRLGQNSVSELSDATSLVSSNRDQRIRAEYGFLASLSKLRSLGAFTSESDLMELLSS